ncbi:MAG TPA: 16S rRNA (guanine(527)-N(7))-methyltransferase RsmG [Candidatus Dormibacteraeota bacterium]|nr:16S rRNA (guanine(527)-N(7))-methyltransferase RsmG [Candidatus Dormibacteraeota bacterium]
MDEPRLRAYLDELDRWNVRINLTAVPREHAWDRHVAEVLPLLDAVAPPPAARVIDVGAGGGVPGVPMAILRPDLRVTLLDSDRRKAAFLTHVAGALQLANVEVLDARAEDAAHRQDLRERFDVAVSRALAPPPVMCELLLPFVRVGGVAATLVGDALQAVRDCDAPARLLGGATPRSAPGDVVLIDKVQPTPAQYPRRAGVPLRKPLG